MQPGNTSGIITDEETVRAWTTGDNGGENAVASDDNGRVNAANNSSREKVAATARRLIEE